MSYDRSAKKEANTRLSLFGQRLQSLSDSFYSTILEDPKEKQLIKNADQFAEDRDYRSTDFTFDQCSVNDLSSKDNFSFTFHSLDQQSKGKERAEKHQVKKTRTNCSSTPNRTKEKDLIKKSEEETIVVEENRRQPMVIGYYPVISYQPVCFPPAIYFSPEQISPQYPRLTKFPAQM